MDPRRLPHASPPAARAAAPQHRTSARWVDGLGNCGVCNSKKDLGDSGTMVVTTDISQPAALPLTPESKLPVGLLPGPAPAPGLHSGDKEHVLGDDRPSSVVDVVSAHPAGPHVEVVSAAGSPPSLPQPGGVLSVVGGTPLKSTQVLGGKFGGLFAGHGTPCVGPCPGYSYSSRAEGAYVATASASYQSFTLSGIHGTLGTVPLMAAPGGTHLQTVGLQRAWL